MRSSLLCGLDVAVAGGIGDPIFVPGNIGAKAARKYLRVKPLQLVEVGNEWGALIDHAREKGVTALMAVGHPGKLVKLWLGDWDTHSARSSAAVEPVRALAMRLTGSEIPVLPTVEGVLAALSAEDRAKVSAQLCSLVRDAIEARLGARGSVAVGMVNMANEWLASSGEIARWQ
jgi:cobalt-precorrin-5B (C1)-methyltransferase